jgi:hypothetical protein
MKDPIGGIRQDRELSRSIVVSITRDRESPAIVLSSSRGTSDKMNVNDRVVLTGNISIADDRFLSTRVSQYSDMCTWSVNENLRLDDVALSPITKAIDSLFVVSHLVLRRNALPSGVSFQFKLSCKVRSS